MSIDLKLISIDDLSVNEIPIILNYWYRSPPGYVEAMGIDWAKMPSELQFEENLKKKCHENSLLSSSKMKELIIRYKSAVIGFHTINPLIENESGVFHAHFSDSQIRGQGLGMYTYVMACRIFFERFNLKTILFKTPLQNIGSIRVKEKLKLNYLGDEKADFGVYKSGIPLKVFELKSQDMVRILKELKL